MISQTIESAVHLKKEPEKTVTAQRVGFDLRRDSRSPTLSAAPFPPHRALLALEIIACRHASCPVLLVRQGR